MKDRLGNSTISSIIRRFMWLEAKKICRDNLWNWGQCVPFRLGHSDRFITIFRILVCRECFRPSSVIHMPYSSEMFSASQQSAILPLRTYSLILIIPSSIPNTVRKKWGGGWWLLSQKRQRNCPGHVRWCGECRGVQREDYWGHDRWAKGEIGSWGQGEICVIVSNNMMYSIQLQ